MKYLFRKYFTGDLVKIYFTSFLVLYLELALIRYLPAHIMYLGYLSNGILIGSMLGIGLGFLLRKSPLQSAGFFPVLILLLMVIARGIGTHMPAIWDNADAVFYKGDLDPIGWGFAPLFTVGALYILIAAVFAALVQPIATIFHRIRRPLVAYFYDVLGSLSGIIAFHIIGSVSGFPPYVWFGFFVTVYLFVTGMSGYPMWRVVFLLLVVVTTVEMGSGVYWSPYSRLLLKYDTERKVGHIFANGITHQYFSRKSDAPFYSLLYARFFQGKAPDKILVIGAGTGQDVSAALTYGAQSVTAVEIDPVIAAIGKAYHPERPYDDSRVRIIIDDGRHFLRTTKERYDLVIYALPDSLYTYAGSGEVRLESFLYTKEAFGDVRRVLYPDGYVAVYNDFRQEWLKDRVRDLLRSGFGEIPKELGLGPTSRVFVQKNTTQPYVSSMKEIPTDDWPFLYIRHKRIPELYARLLIVMFGLSVVSILAVRRFYGGVRDVTGNTVPLFFLGAAFSLIETKSIVEFALLFGSTWYVNAVAFGGILSVTLCAVILRTIFGRISIRLLWGLLFVSLIGPMFLPFQSVFYANSMGSVFGAVWYLFSPVFAANLLFSSIFSDSGQADSDFGWNLLGLVFGACVEYLALVTGYGKLTGVALLFYLMAFLFWHIRNRSRLNRSAAG